MAKTYQWEIIPEEEMESFYIWTAQNNILTAAQSFVDQYGDHITIYGIRKAAELREFEEAI